MIGQPLTRTSGFGVEYVNGLILVPLPAARTMAATPGALHLRTLSTINDVSSDQSNTLIFCLPIEMIESFKAGNGVTNLAKKLTGNKEEE